MWSACRRLSQWWLVFVLLGVHAILSDGCGIWYHLQSFREVNISRVVPRLYGWVYKTIRLSPLVVEHSAVVMGGKLNSMGSQFSIPVLWSLSSESTWAQNVEAQLRTPTLGVRVQSPLEWNTYFLLNTDIANLCGKLMRGRQKALFC